MFGRKDSEAALIVAVNVFNCVRRNVFLHNIRIICPPLSNYVYNCYSSPVSLLITGSTEMKSSEGTTQSDPAAMTIYAISIIPMIIMPVETVNNIPNNETKSVAYADDLSAARRISELKVWWDNLMKFRPKFGYYAQPSKSWLIIKEKNFKTARTMFNNTKVNITTDGKRHLGPIIVSERYKQEYIS